MRSKPFALRLVLWLLIAAAGFAAVSVSAQDKLTAYFFDVGQADCTLLIGDDVVVVIDAGDYRRNDVVPHLQSVGVEAIDLLIGTHPHADHIGQFPQVLAAFPVQEVWLSGDLHTTATFERALDAILASDADYYEPRAGEYFYIGLLRLEVLNPVSLTGDLHEGCIAVRAVFGDTALLFTGDIEAETEYAMLDREGTLQAELFQLGHHGSSTSSTRAFLEAVAPTTAIYSAGKENPFGHPHDEVIERLVSMGIPYYGTDIHGTIRVDMDGTSYTVTTERGAAVENEQSETTGAADAAPAVRSGEDGMGCAPGQVNVNTASLDQLLEIVHIGPGRAEELIALRPFAALAELTRISGIGPSRLEDILEQGLACVEY